MSELTTEELKEKIEWYEDRGWTSNAEAVKAELHERDGEMSYEEQLEEANLTGSEQLRCGIVGFENE